MMGSFHNFLFQAKHWIVVILILNIGLFYYKDSIYSYKQIYSIEVCQDVHCILFSMFLHANTSHLFHNMLSFVFTSYDLFINTHKQPSYWNHAFAFFLIYFLSGIIGASSNIALDRYYRFLWQARLESNQSKVTCTHWLCENALNHIMKPLATAVTYVYHSKEYVAIKMNQFVPRIGASGGVYGLFGARIYTACFSSDHARLGFVETAWYVFMIGQELSQIPTSLEDLSRALWEEGDMIDHLCHVASLFGGLGIAMLFHQFVRCCS